MWMISLTVVSPLKLWMIITYSCKSPEDVDDHHLQL
jgi:hypothetical protein